MTLGGIFMTEITASMAGNVWKVLVKAGDEVEEDQDIAILESMKMEIPIATDFDGVVKEVKVNEGEFVNEGDVIAVIE
ncbi:acetyl-CoA carboxylase biotin carboxyl carrier protein subunit [Sporosarcina sp. P21c]|nr:acetyl-CoA carboxylase biotin carboxyl carrier protein subunit [Sporosarcina sp. P16a]PIC83778.1 acetyl-CoA carboxylase biotin carboxyl carrier protein subunit [Sporosarcina sp. P1]PIC90644.1 acetyl-CoA carboxylase biotin carboxyl carrier protein subunit [Sporosarcina sp. P21c]PIC93410.1 acetyl-CoA carboxylase biotin carboxyl carrier protein subunit [Sporosarcina sp. P25]